MQQFDIRLLVLDIDGTIAGASNQISHPVLQAIAAVQQRGVLVTIATGRMYRSAQRFHQAIGSDLPLIAYQGAWIQSPADAEPIQHCSVPRPLVESLLTDLEHPTLRSRVGIHFYINDQLYVRELTAETVTYAARSGIQPIPIGDLRNTLDQEPTKILALSEDTQLIQGLLERLQQQYAPTELYLTKSVPTFLEATHPKANKGAAVQYLAETQLGLKPEQVMAIGDNLNDLEMIEYAGLGIAMGNAPEAVQLRAQWVAPTVESDGAAAAIAEFLL